MVRKRILFNCVLLTALVTTLVPVPVLAAASPPEADLELDKDVDNARPNVGDDVTFTITLTNDGPDTATNVEVSEIWPAGLNYVSDDGDGTHDPGTGIWDVGSLPSGDTVTLHITATVETPGPFTNVAEVSASDQFDPDSIPGNDDLAEDDKDMATVVPYVADLSLITSVDNTSPDVGDDVTFTILLTNEGPDAATNVEVSDLLPTGLGYVSDDSGGTYDPATGIWDVGSLPGGDTVTLDITATVEGLGTFTNAARVTSSDQFDPDSTPGNDDTSEDDQDVAIFHVGSVADLAVVKTGFPGLVVVGHALVYTILVTNDGPADATGVTLTDVLPADVTFGSAIPSQGSCIGTDTVTCTLGNLANDTTAMVVIIVTPTTAGTMINRASVTGDEFDPDVANNTDTASVNVINPAIVIAKTPDAQTVYSGSAAVFTISVTNTGDVALADVTVTDEFAPGCDANLGSLDAGASIRYNCTVANVMADFTNSATVTGTPPAGADVTDTDIALVHVAPTLTPMVSTIYLPTIINSRAPYVQAPDLVVEHIIATSNGVYVVIKNQGDAPVLSSEAFWVDLYVNPDPVPTSVNQTWGSLCHEGLVWGVVATALPLEPGDALVLTIGDAYYWPEHSNFSGSLPAGTPIYVQVDSANANTTYGAVLESHEIVGGPYNNISAAVYSTGGVGEGMAETGPPAMGGRLPASSRYLPPRPPF